MVIRYGAQILLPIYLVLMLMVSGPFAAQNSGLDGKTEVTLDFQNVELVDMINTISELTGKNFVYDEAVRGKVSVVSPKPISVKEAYRLFSTVLKVKGFTIIPSGKVNKIVPIRTAKEENLPIIKGQGYGEQFVTRLIDLKSLDASIAVDTILRPLMPKTSHVVAHAPTNTVIITDSAANIDRLNRILMSLDKSWDGERMEIVPLQFSEADETAALVMQILEGSAVVQGRGPAKGAVSRKKAAGQVLPYGRTNKILLLGDAAFIASAKKIILQLDEKADLRGTGVHVYYLENAEAEGLAETLNRILAGATKSPTAGKKAPTQAPSRTLFGDVGITADKPTNALIINAMAEDYEGIRGLIEQLDIKRKQVFVEVLILELSMDALLDVGVSLQGAVDTGTDSVVFGTSNLNTGSAGLSVLNPDSDTTSPSLLSQAINGLLLGGLFNPISTIGPDGTLVQIPALSVLIDLSQTDTNVNVLSAPRLLTSDNEEAEIIVGSNVPIITSNTKDNDGNPINSVERQDVALTLRVTPQITEGDLVRLKIYQEISDVAPANANVGNVNEVGPTLTKRLLRSTIVARDGKTVVLGGLFKTNQQKQVTKIPLLGDIPILGHLFKRTSDNESKTSLLIFITPRVIRSSDDLEKVTQENRDTLSLYREEEGSSKVFGVETQVGKLPTETGE